ncbi:hypothetical protein MUCCIDRAFT_130883, partial [Mucor lusitanicus CBS 277.49]
RIQKEDEARLLKARKLSLIVDLDQTILHAAWEPHIAEWVDSHKEKRDSRAKDMSTFTLDGSKYTIKLRPGTIQFLKDMSKLYEMHVYTMGTRAYAKAVAAVIDPTMELFQDRILTRDENGSLTKKRLDRLFPADQSKVVVLDDRADVWDYSPNLIQIKPYEYFAGVGDINAPPNAQSTNVIPPEILKDDVNTTADVNSSEQGAVSETDRTVNNKNQKPANNILASFNPKHEDTDRILQVISRALTDVHDEFYRRVDQGESEPHVAIILPEIKRNVLKDCTLVFSGVIPLHYRPQDATIWKMATAFGATCLEELTGKVTHLVAANAGTSKVNTARRYPHIKIVSPPWLMNSIWNFKRENDAPYII